MVSEIGEIVIVVLIARVGSTIMTLHIFLLIFFGYDKYGGDQLNTYNLTKNF